MSAYAEIKTRLNDPDLIVKALKAMNYEFIATDPNGIPLRSHAENRYRTRNDYADTDNRARALTAQIVLRKESLGKGYNDVGFKLMPDGTYNIIPSSFDDSVYNKDFAKKLKFNYAEQNILRAAKVAGLRGLGAPRKLADGRLEYQFLGR